MSHRDNVFEAAVAQELVTGGHVNQRLFMEQGEIVANTAGALRPDCVTTAEQLRHEKVVREVLTRMHQERDRGGSWDCAQQPAHGGTVGGGQLVSGGDGG